MTSAVAGGPWVATPDAGRCAGGDARAGPSEAGEAPEIELPDGTRVRADAVGGAVRGAPRRADHRARGAPAPGPACTMAAPWYSRTLAKLLQCL